MKITNEQQTLLQRHLDLVLETNEKFNLTRIETPGQARILHIEDSLAGAPIVQGAPKGSLVDLGSGAGWPGIPLAVTTGREVTLVESLKKKACALEDIIDGLNLDNVTVYAGRAEELAVENTERYAVVTARALTQLPSLIELASPLLVQGGQLIAYKSDDIEEELAQAWGIQHKVGMAYIETVRTVLSDGTPRSFVIFEKKGQPEVDLPRRPGMAQKRPYRA